MLSSSLCKNIFADHRLEAWRKSLRTKHDQKKAYWHRPKRRRCYLFICQSIGSSSHPNIEPSSNIKSKFHFHVCSLLHHSSYIFTVDWSLIISLKRMGADLFTNRPYLEILVFFCMTSIIFQYKWHLLRATKWWENIFQNGSTCYATLSIIIL